MGEDVVRASSVRWRPNELAAPPRIELTSNPFEEVLVADDEAIAAEEAVIEVVPLGPPAQELKAGLRLDGFANTAGRIWAVVNGRPRLPGDAVRTSDTNQYLCRLESIESNHIIVRCEDTVTEIHLRSFGSQRKGAATSDSVESVEKPDEESGGGTPENPLPPQP